MKKNFLLCLFPLLLNGCLFADRPLVQHLADKVITLDTVWNGIIIIDGTVKVTKSARLVIAPGTDIRFVRRDRDQDGLGDAVLAVEGELLAIGTPQQPIRFRSAETDPQPGDWLELRVDFSRNTVLRWCELRDSAHTLHAHFTKGVMEDCHVHHNIDGTRLGEARFVLRNNLFEDNLGKGINYRNATVEIAYNTIRRNRAGLFLFETDRESDIHHNNFIDNGDNLRLGDFFTGTVGVRDNWWGATDPAAAAATIYDRKADPAIGTVEIAPASAWWHAAVPRRMVRFEETWRYSTGKFVDSPVQSFGETLYVPGWDGKLHALDSDGQPLWQQPLDDIADAMPLVTDTAVVVQDWSRTVRALSSRDGRELWRFVYPASPADDHRQGGLVLHGKNVLVPAWNGTLYALDLISGVERWHYATAGPLRSTPLVLGEKIVIASEDGAVHALSPGGELLWKVETDSPLRAAPVAHAAGLIAVNRAGEVVSLLEDGSLHWQRALGEESFYAAPLVADGAVFIATAAGSLWKLDATDGSTIWRRELDSSLYATPTLISGLLALGDNCGRLHLLDPVGGATLGTYVAGDAIQSPVLEHDGLLIFGSRDGFVHAVKPVITPVGGGE